MSAVGMAGEYIEAFLNLEGAKKLTDKEIAADVMDNMYAQGLFGENPTEAELDLAEKQIAEQVSYYR